VGCWSGAKLAASTGRTSPVPPSVGVVPSATATAALHILLLPSCLYVTPCMPTPSRGCHRFVQDSTALFPCLPFSTYVADYLPRRSHATIPSGHSRRRAGCSYYLPFYNALHTGRDITLLPFFIVGDA